MAYFKHFFTGFKDKYAHKFKALALRYESWGKVDYQCNILLSLSCF
ncbi:hypothetical protein M23134_02291 [Microscilla marina ATCC 23134]|uniref:Uncharacterized protein n=1 Tax=Microscilla marina ATCC 23134 TaxID=313606 RepID=A1ZK74_MICM2|nr:hypothetical protein M23134_02291 [Microscilla marina ATCC 23134]